MRVTLEVDDLLPEPEEVLAALSVPPGAEVSQRLFRMVDEALERLAETAEPAAVVEAVTPEAFGALLAPGPPHATDPVVGWIYPRAEALALFAGTLGPQVTRETEDLFAQDDYPMAVTLDAAASRMAEELTEELSDRLLDEVAGDDEASPLHVLAYSPGYCGWHVTGQRALFARLRAEEIGITLTGDCLMHPLKSVSGVLVAAPAEVHRFQPGFSYCDACRDRTCTVRMDALDPGARER